MGPEWMKSAFGTARDAAEGEVLKTIEAEFPEVDVHYLHGGFVALPEGTKYTTAATIGRLLEKLRGAR